MSDRDVPEEKRNAADRIVRQAQESYAGPALNSARNAELSVVIDAIAQISSPLMGDRINSEIEARREAMALIVQERIAKGLVEASGRVAAAGAVVAFVGVVLAALQAYLAFVALVGGSR